MSPPITKEPRVGVGVFILNSKNQFIVGKRKGSYGSGTYALPGGHLEFGETFEECAARETLEETGLTTSHERFLTATNNVMVKEDAHYVTVFVTARVRSGSEKVEPEVLEPEKCEGWEWVSWEELREWADAEKKGQGERKLFLPLLDLFDHRPGIDPAQNN